MLFAIYEKILQWLYLLATYTQGIFKQSVFIFTIIKELGEEVISSLWHLLRRYRINLYVWPASMAFFKDIKKITTQKASL